MKTLHEIDRLTKLYEHKFSNETQISPKFVAGRKCKLHAIARMMARGIHASYVEETLEMADPHTIVDRKRPGHKLHRYIFANSSVTIDPDTNEIITVGYGYNNDPYWDHERKQWRPQVQAQLRSETRDYQKHRRYERLMMPGKY